jgi:hypothetical protein
MQQHMQHFDPNAAFGAGLLSAAVFGRRGFRRGGFRRPRGFMRRGFARRGFRRRGFWPRRRRHGFYYPAAYPVYPAYPSWLDEDCIDRWGRPIPCEYDTLYGDDEYGKNVALTVRRTLRPKTVPTATEARSALRNVGARVPWVLHGDDEYGGTFGAYDHLLDDDDWIGDDDWLGEDDDDLLYGLEDDDDLSDDESLGAFWHKKAERKRRQKARHAAQRRAIKKAGFKKRWHARVPYQFIANPKKWYKYHKGMTDWRLKKAGRWLGKKTGLTKQYRKGKKKVEQVQEGISQAQSAWQSAQQAAQQGQQTAQQAQQAQQQLQQYFGLQAHLVDPSVVYGDEHDDGYGILPFLLVPGLVAAGASTGLRARIRRAERQLRKHGVVKARLAAKLVGDRDKIIRRMGKAKSARRIERLQKWLARLDKVQAQIEATAYGYHY